MARYKGVLQGDKGKVSRLGSASSGITCTLSGWENGVQVTIKPDTDGKDCVYICRTTGTVDNNKTIHEPIALNILLELYIQYNLMRA